jgi:hypothetical protein
MAFFEECDDILNNVIGEKILRNQDLCKLLYYYSDTKDYNFDPLSQPDIEDTSELLMQYIFPMPKSPDMESEQKGYLTVVLTGGDRYSGEVNTGYRRINLVFDIIIHLNQWIIQDSYRVYRIASELDKMFNNQLTDLPIIGKPFYSGFKVKDYNNSFYGLQLVYVLSVNSNIECGQSSQNLRIKESLDNYRNSSAMIISSGN